MVNLEMDVSGEGVEASVNLSNDPELTGIGHDLSPYAANLWIGNDAEGEAGVTLSEQEVGVLYEALGQVLRERGLLPV